MSHLRRVGRWFRQLAKRLAVPHRKREKNVRRLVIETLEDRTLLSVSPVETVGFPLPVQFHLKNLDGFLGPVSSAPPLEVAQAFLTAHAPDLGLTAADVANPAITDQYTSDTGTAHIYFRQRFNGLEVANTAININITADGQVINLGGGFVGGLSALESDPAYLPIPSISAADSVFDIADDLGVNLAALPRLIDQIGGLEQAAILQSRELSLDPIPVHLTYVATPAGVKLAWDMVIRTTNGQHWYNLDVDAASGQLLLVSDWIDHAGTYHVFALPAESPQDGGRTYLVNPETTAASPFGWQDTNGIAGAEFTDTRGNNVVAQEDTDANDTGGFRPVGGSMLLFDFPLDLAQTPTGYQSAAITNLFYMNNALHDIHQRYGFTESAGNFQQLNYSGSGAGNDAVQADAQDGSGTDNANFGTPPDGTAPRMQQFIFTSTVPNRDSDIDNGIIIHEYGHGVSTRLTGGPANSNSLDALQSGGMGEGWSDWWVLMLTQRATDTQNASYPMGTYVLGQAPTGPGIRTYPYSFNMGVNPHTWGDYNFDNEVHYTGEIWASTLWDLNWLLINKYGFDPDLTTGYSAGAGPAGAGNKLAMQLVMDGLKLQPANPTFVNARDALLLADQTLTGGVNKREIWTAFSRRGLGLGASTANSNSTIITTAVNVPAALANPAVTGITPVGVTASAPNRLDITFSEAMDQTSFSVAADVSSFTNPANADIRAQITGFSWLSSTTLRVNFTSQTAPGQYTMVLGPDILALDNGSRLDQDTDGTAGEAFEDRFTARFSYASVTMQVVSTDPPNGSLVNLPFTTLDVNFSEPFDPATLGANDLQLAQGTVTGVTQVDADTARYTLSGIAQNPILFNIKYGAVSDLFGFPVQFYSGSVTGDISSIAFPVPLVSVQPLGSLVYDPAYASAIDLASDTDSFTINLDAGLRVTVLVDPAAGLQPTLELRDPSNTLIGSTTAAAAGSDAVLQSILASTSGTYTVTVGGASVTTGNYTLQVFLNAGLEMEEHNGSTNNSRAFAQNLDANFLPLSGSVQATALLGTTSSEGMTTVLTTDFESGSAGFTVDNTGGGLWHISVGRALQPGHSASQSFYYGQAEGPLGGGNFSTGGTNRGRLTSLPIALPNATPITLDFNYVLQTEYSFSYDLAQFQISTNGGAAYTTIANYNAAAESSTWRAATPVNLSSYAGQTVLLRWYFDTVDSIANTYEGWYVDDIRVQAQAVANDFYSVSLAAGQYLCVDLEGLTPGNVDLQLQDSTGAILANGITSASNVDEFFTFTAAVAGTYFLRVSGLPTINYNLLLTKGAIFEHEANDTFGTAQNANTPKAALGYIQGANDDWFQFAVSAGYTMNVSTSTPGGGTGEFVNVLDPYLELYSPANVLLRSDDNSADGRNALLTQFAASPGNYRVRVRGVASSGEYFLNMSIVDATPPTATALTASNAALSPNSSSGVKDDSTFAANFTDISTVNWTLTITNSSAATVRTFTGAGNLNQLWNGRDTGGVFVPDGAYTATLTFSDSAGNSGATSNIVVTVDNTPPSVASIALVGPSLTGASSVSFNVTFSETVANVDAGDFQLASLGVLGPFISGVSGSGANYTVTVNTGTGDGTIGLNLVTNPTIQDSAGNSLPGPFTGPVYTIDKTAPTVLSINRTTPSGPSTNAASVVYTVTFSEAVTAVDETDFSLTLGGVTTAPPLVVSGSGTTYTVTINGIAGSGTLRLDLVDDDSITDGAGNPLSGTGAGTGNLFGQTYLIDRVAPTVVSINRTTPPGPMTNAGSVVYTVTFSEPVGGVDPADFGLTLAGVTTAPPLLVAGSGAAYTVTINGIVGNGSLGLNLLDNDSILDAVGNPLGDGGAGNGNFGGEVYGIDQIAPAVLSIDRTIPSSPTTNSGTVDYTVTFDEPVIGIDAADFALDLAGLTTTPPLLIAGSGTTFTVTVLGINGDGTLGLNLVDNDSITDLAGNPLGGTGAGNGSRIGEVYDIDHTMPAVLAINRTAPAGPPTNAASVVYSVTFSENVANVEESDFAVSLSGVTIAPPLIVTGSGTAYTVTVNGITGNGTLRLNLVDDDSILDGAGNPVGDSGAGNGNFAGQVYIIDQTAPTVLAINRTTPAASLTNAGVVTYTVTFSEAVSGVDPTDFTLALAGVSTTPPLVVSGSGSIYTVTISGIAGNGTLGLNLIDGDSILDAAGNLLGGPGAGNGNRIGQVYTIDQTAPTVLSINRTTPPGPTTNATNVVFTVIFSESVSNVDAADFALALTGVTTAPPLVVAGSGTTYTVTVNGISGNGSLGLNLVDDNSIRDTAGNFLGGSGPGDGNALGQAYVIDQTAPQPVSINRTTPTGPATNATSLVFTVAFSETVSGVDPADFILTLSGVTTSPPLLITLSGSTYLVTVNGVTGNGTIGLNLVDNDSIRDTAGNYLGGSGLGNANFGGPAYSIDQTAPTVLSIDRATPIGPATNSSTATFAILFSEAVSGIDQTDFALALGGVTTSGPLVLTGTGASYIVTVNGIVGTGTLGLNLVDNDSITDAVNNSLGGSGALNGNFSGQVYAIDQTSPAVVAIDRGTPTGPATYFSTLVFTVNFSEIVTNVDASDFAAVMNGVTSSPALIVAGSGATYTVTVNGVVGNGTLGLKLLDNDSIRDAVGNILGGIGTTNGNFTGQAYTIDQIVPIVGTINRTTPTGPITNSSNVIFTVQFTEPVFGVEASDFALTLSGVTVSQPLQVAGAGTTYTVTVDGIAGEGTLGLNLVDDDSVQDEAGNPLGSPGAGNENFSGQIYAVPFFTDVFSGANGASLGAAWKLSSGTVKIQSGQAQSVGSLGLSTLNAVNMANGFVQADASFSAVGQSAGLVARYAGPGMTNMYWGGLVKISATQLQVGIHRNVNGAWLQLYSQTINGTGGTLRLEVVGVSLKLFLNGTLVAFGQDALLTTGSVGLCTTAGAAFDNFNVCNLNVAVTTIPFNDRFSTQASVGQLANMWMDRVGNTYNVGQAAIGQADLNIVTVNGVSMANGFVQADASLSAAGQYAGLVARYSGPGAANMYWGSVMKLSATQLRASIYRNLNGAWTQLFTQDVQGTDGRLRFEVLGSSLKLLLNGVLVAFAQDYSLATGTIGLGTTAGARFDNFASSTLSTTAASLPFNDTYSGASNQLANTWSDQVGGTGIVGGSAVGQASVNVATANGINLTDGFVQADASFSAVGQYAGLLARYSGPGDANFYLGGLGKISPTQLQAHLYRNISGTWTLLSSKIVTGAGGTLRLEMIGSSLKLFLNNEIVSFAHDAALTGGTIGMRTTAGAALDNFSANTMSVAAASLPFADTYSSPGIGSQLANTWLDRAGNTTIIGGAAVGQSPLNLASVTGTNMTDGFVQADATFSAPGQYAGLVARYSGPGDTNMYLGILGRISATQVRAYLYRNISGAWTMLSNQFVTATGGTLRFEVMGSSLKLFLNGILVGFAQDTALTNGAVGIRTTAGGAFDNFSAGPLSVAAASFPFADAFSSPGAGDQLANTWKDRAGNTTIVAGAAIGQASVNVATLNGITMTDGYVEADTILTAVGQHAGLISRYSGPGDANMYLGLLVKTSTTQVQAYIIRSTANGLLVLSSKILAGTGGTLRFETIGSSLKLFLDGVLITSAQDALLTSGAIGMRISGGAGLDNFSAA